MTETAVKTSVSTETVVAATPERAFHVYTAEMIRWWPESHHVIEGELAAMVVEPRPGGRVYDRTADGTESTWGHVLAYEPPSRFVFSWDLAPNWELEPDPSRCSEVEVRFIAEGEGTRVVLEHRHLDRHGRGWEGMRDAVESPAGWPLAWPAFAAAVSA